MCSFIILERKGSVKGFGQIARKVFAGDGKSPARSAGRGLCEAFGVFGVLAEFGGETFGKIIPNFFPIVVAYGG